MGVRVWIAFMRALRHFIFFFFVALEVLLVASCTSHEMTMPKFRKLDSFEGRVTKVEKIDYAKGFVPHSASAPDFRVTIVRNDGSTIVIERIHTQFAQENALKELTRRSVRKFPDEVVQCEDRIGKENY